MRRGARSEWIRNGGAFMVWTPTKSGIGSPSATLHCRRRYAGSSERTHTMEYGIGGILILILVILAIIYFAKRV